MVRVLVVFACGDIVYKMWCVCVCVDGLEAQTNIPGTYCFSGSTLSQWQHESGHIRGDLSPLPRSLHGSSSQCVEGGCCQLIALFSTHSHSVVCSTVWSGAHCGGQKTLVRT